MQLQESVRLTQQVKAGGCASKLAPGVLEQVLGRLPKQHDSNVLVGFETSDDAGVYRLSDDLALVQTVDFFTPMVDDPFTYGQIAATNAISDVYAMGGRPITALALVCYPEKGDVDVLTSVMSGGLSVMSDAGCSVVGGHSVKDSEMKFGYAVTGLIDPARVFTNSGAKAGDDLLLTKGLGTGVITTALKQGRAEQQWIDGAIRSMITSNRAAIETATSSEFGVHAVTDVTGFGLMGHAREMALGGGVALEIAAQAVPLLAGALDAVRIGAIPAGLIANREFAECLVSESSNTSISPHVKTLFFDPQTSGGLLIAVDAALSSELLSGLIARGLPAAKIGRVLSFDVGSNSMGRINLV